MASQAQRRARREARRGDVAAAPPPAPPLRPTARGGGDAHSEPHGRKRRFNFIRESWEELQKVEWPNQNQVVQGTIVVLVACIIVGFYLWGADQVFRRLVQQVFLGE
jgi:preprotein translocase subunit SecE